MVLSTQLGELVAIHRHAEAGQSEYIMGCGTVGRPLSHPKGLNEICFAEGLFEPYVGKKVVRGPVINLHIGYRMA